MRKLVSIIVPVYNEEESLLVFHDSVTQVIDTLSNYDWEILYINDGSTDQTQTIIQQLFEKDKRIAFLQLSRNFGKENAMLAGFDYAHGDCAIVMDADLQDSPDLITDMLSNWEQGYEDVYAKRRSRGKESWLRRKCSMLFYNILERSIRFEVLKNVGDFRLLDRKCIDALKQLRENERYTKGLYCWIGFNKKEIVFDRGNRQYGKSHWDYFSLIGLAFDGIISFTTAPLRLSSHRFRLFLPASRIRNFCRRSLYSFPLSCLKKHPHGCLRLSRNFSHPLSRPHRRNPQRSSRDLPGDLRVMLPALKPRTAPEPAAVRTERRPLFF